MSKSNYIIVFITMMATTLFISCKDDARPEATEVVTNVPLVIATVETEADGVGETWPYVNVANADFRRIDYVNGWSYFGL